MKWQSKFTERRDPSAEPPSELRPKPSDLMVCDAREEWIPESRSATKALDSADLKLSERYWVEFSSAMLVNDLSEMTPFSLNMRFESLLSLQPPMPPRWSWFLSIIGLTLELEKSSSFSFLAASIDFRCIPEEETCPS